MERLKTTQVAAYRALLLDKQGGKCVLCGERPEVPVLDHCHSEGHIRGTLCRGCNSLLGVIENNRKRYGLANITKLARFLSSVPQYLMHARHPVLHPTHKTEDEKRELRNKRARAARAKKAAA